MKFELKHAIFSHIISCPVEPGAYISVRFLWWGLWKMLCRGMWHSCDLEERDGSEGGGSIFLQNVGTYHPNYKALHPRRQGFKLIILLFSDWYWRTISYSTGSCCIDFWGMFTKLQKVAVSFAICLWMQQLSSHWSYFHRIWYCRISWKSVK